ncbi:MAG: substrate-binding domain-containing protein [Rhodobacteraceae bacterium]|nr:substrate-binding domain-containing protein [Paracoccaceae bacterium]
MWAYTSRYVVVGAVLSVITSSVFAANITLRSPDGAFSLSGELVEFDGIAYIMDSAIGRVRIEVNLVICVGDDCPDLSALSNDFMVVITNAVGKSLLPMLLEDFATSEGLRSVMEGTTGVAFEDSDGEVAAMVTLANVDTGAGLGAIADGTALLAIALRQASRDEVSAISDAGFGDITRVAQQTVLAMDGLVILVSSDNPVNSLTIQQVGDIFSGTVTNWNEIGGLDAAINVYRQNVAASDSEFFRSEVLAQTGGDYTQAASIISSNGNISQSVSQDAFGIGFSSFANKGAAKTVSLQGSCGILSEPTNFSIKTEEYLLSRRLLAYTPDRVLPDLAGGLIAYLDSDAAQIQVAQAGYVSLNAELKSVNGQGLRFANAILTDSNEIDLSDLKRMASLLVDAKRLSTTFRFVDGSSTLDARAERDVERLVDWLIDQDLTNKQILLVGFTDNNGKLNVNMALAEQRAEQVLDEMTAIAPAGMIEGINVKIVGLGETSPLACSTASRGRFMNRRVEVWIGDEN